MLDLKESLKIAEGTLAAARERGFKPMSVVVYDVRGALRAAAAEDGTSLRRTEIAMGKANGALALGMGSRAVGKAAVERPHFIAAVTHSVGAGELVPGGVLVRDAEGAPLGVVGVSGDTSDNDETCAVAAIEAAGLRADPGA